jgi:hypothetical protein
LPSWSSVKAERLGRISPTPAHEAAKAERALATTHEIQPSGHLRSQLVERIACYGKPGDDPISSFGLPFWPLGVSTGVGDGIAVADAAGDGDWSGPGSDVHAEASESAAT